MLDDALTARIATAKKRLLDGGMLQEVEWGIPGERDERGRRTYAFETLDALIEQRPALDRGTLDTDRSDNTVLVVLDPVAIFDDHQFRFGDPLHAYSVKAIDGACAGRRQPARDTPPKSPLSARVRKASTS